MKCLGKNTSGLKYIFSLTELIIVIAILAILLSLLTPTLNRMVQETVTLQCLQNHGLVASSIQLFSEDYQGNIVGSGSHIISNGSSHSVSWVYILNNSGYLPTGKYIDEMGPVPSDKLICPNAGDVGNTIRTNGINRTLNSSGITETDPSKFPVSDLISYEHGYSISKISQPSELYLTMDIHDTGVPNFRFNNNNDLVYLSDNYYIYSSITSSVRGPALRHQNLATVASKVDGSVQKLFYNPGSPLFTSESINP